MKADMAYKWRSPVFFILLMCIISANYVASQSTLVVDAYAQYGRKIPDTLFGIFFEEINHAGAGGIWSELVSNRGFEAGGQNTPSVFMPWDVIGDKTLLTVTTERTSLFQRNPVALRIEVNCDSTQCPFGGVGVFNPGFWGMNIENGKTYTLIFYVKSLGDLDMTVSLTTSDGLLKLASTDVIKPAPTVSDWTRLQLALIASGSSPNGRLQFTTKKRGTIWLDQVSLMPLDTYKGHGLREDLMAMVESLKPRFIRFPGGCYVEGVRLWNAFRWASSVGPWEERPGHYSDVWNYWTDDGLGYFEFLQLAEDLGAAPVWVINIGISHNDSVAIQDLSSWVQDALNSIEFARGDTTTIFGKLRAQMGHPDPFPLTYMAIGNEDCEKPNYLGNYLKFYNAIRSQYPDIKLITNCNGLERKLDHPADYYDFHIYTSSQDMFNKKNIFDGASKSGPKAFVSEYAVKGWSAGKGNLGASLGEAAFLIGLEKNSDVVGMASYAPLFVNINNRAWIPDAIVFDSAQAYGTPSYWMQHFFKDSSGATLNPVVVNPDMSGSIATSTITYINSDDNKTYLKIKIVNFGETTINLNIAVNGLPYAINALGSSKTVMTSGSIIDENSFLTPTKIVPVKTPLVDASTNMVVQIVPHSITSYDLQLGQPLSDTNMSKEKN